MAQTQRERDARLENTIVACLSELGIWTTVLPDYLRRMIKLDAPNTLPDGEGAKADGHVDAFPNFVAPLTLMSYSKNGKESTASTMVDLEAGPCVVEQHWPALPLPPMESPLHSNHVTLPTASDNLKEARTEPPFEVGLDNTQEDFDNNFFGRHQELAADAQYSSWPYFHPDVLEFDKQRNSAQREKLSL